MTQEYTGIEKANLVLGSNMLVDWCAFVSSTGEQLKGGDWTSQVCPCQHPRENFRQNHRHDCRLWRRTTLFPAIFAHWSLVAPWVLRCSPFFWVKKHIQGEVPFVDLSEIVGSQVTPTEELLKSLDALQRLSGALWVPWSCWTSGGGKCSYVLFWYAWRASWLSEDHLTEGVIHIPYVNMYVCTVIFKYPGTRRLRGSYLCEFADTSY